MPHVHPTPAAIFYEVDAALRDEFDAIEAEDKVFIPRFRISEAVRRAMGSANRKHAEETGQ